MGLKYCSNCDEEYDVDDAKATCPECEGPLEAVDDGDDDEEEGEWGEE